MCTSAGGTNDVDQQESSDDGSSWLMVVFGGLGVLVYAGGGALLRPQRLRDRVRR